MGRGVAISKRKRIWLGALAGVVALAVVAWLATDAIRRTLMRRFDSGYTPPAAAVPEEELAATRKVRLEPVARGLEQITDVQLVSSTPRTAVVLEKAGRAKVVELGEPTGSDVRNAAGAPVLFEVEVESSR